jgi:hypothetical protein
MLPALADGETDYAALVSLADTRPARRPLNYRTPSGLARRFILFADGC